MKTLIVYAHPEPRSLNGSLKDLAVSTLQAAGHEVRVSDLYAMNWKAVVDAADFGGYATSPLRVTPSSGRAYDAGALTPEVRAEQEKLLWADTVIFQFPLWWYTMPAILKGWVDRVFSFHFAYGVGVHDETRYGERFGEGTLLGRRAVLSVTIGGPESQYTDRGINGPIEDLLFPIHHGILYYPGLEVLPPFVLYRADRISGDEFADVAKRWQERLLTLETTPPIAFRRQNSGDYEIPSLRLREGLEAPGRSGFDLHVRAG
ncbi:NAD(P)H-dependent oxidoreductase [Micromonospora rifamycinica]|uniref:NAD(P)H dehydrogenase (Quinone) n=1 Tax=Micromonospora rifamycinica TaxID=291594 RepID=A0A109IGS2_9ACTN|nr:NAD(P)H-dependent oxidoreductase [Micromonospora rifamycinica]KWV30163.1 NAD(P)H dehydrogenase [Micromonospora rifamycinica]SCG64674.1 NAD(P)H dehydrogenase (quinone) [Micromonospora rifamycinica]